MTIHNTALEPRYLSPALAVFMALGAYLLFTAGDTMGKWLQADYPASQILLGTNLVGLVIMSAYAIYKRGLKKAFHSRKWKLHFIRGGIIGISTMFVFYALKRLPLSDFYGIIFLSPIWITLLSRIFLKEHIPPSRIVAIGVGFLGVVVITGAEFSTFNTGFLATLVSSLLGATAALISKQIGSHEPSANFGISTHLALVIANIPMAYAQATPPTLFHTGMVVVYGIILSTAMLSIALVFSRSRSASQVAPLQYTQMLWGILFGWLVFHQSPTPNVLAGAMLVMAAGYYVMHSMRRGHKA